MDLPRPSILKRDASLAEYFEVLEQDIDISPIKKASNSTNSVAEGDALIGLILRQMGSDPSLLAKASRNITPSFYENYEEVEIEAKTTEDATDTKAIRRAIHVISNYYNTLGVYRDDFVKNDNDKFARNAYYAICEKAMMDYMGSVDWVVHDAFHEPVDSATEFLENPNPQEDFSGLMKPVIRDVTRYDAATWVKSFNYGGTIEEIKAYLGTEFWPEVDRVPMIINVPLTSTIALAESKLETYPTYQGWWSHGYVVRYWQRSRTGVYVPFIPEELSYFMMYPRSDGLYGTDFIKYLKYQIQYLIDSTRAAGKTFENQLVPSIIWEHPEIRSIQQLEERIAQVQAKTGAMKFGSVIHAVNGEKIHTLAQTLHDMEWLSGQKFVAQLVWAMWGFSQDEFMGGEGGANRATAYVKRNITKSRLLYPMMDYFERRINRTVLPFLKGYKKGWQFEFLRDVDLDDEQKQAQTRQIKSSTVASYMGLGFKPSTAIELAGLKDELKGLDPEELDEEIEEYMQEQMMMEMGGEGEMGEIGGMGMEGGMGGEDIEGDRYNGTGSYLDVNEADYGLGAEAEKPREGAEEEKQFKKAKVYIMHPSEAPKGRTVRRGTRGGYYYITTAKEKSEAGPTASKKRPKKGKKGGKGGWGGSAATSRGYKPKMSEPPEPPEMDGSEKVIVTGESVGVVLVIKNGKLQGKVFDNEKSRLFMKQVKERAKGSSPKAILKAAADLGNEMGLQVNSSL